MSKLKYLFGPMRLPFVILAPVCVLLGFSIAVWTSMPLNALHVILTFIGGISAHISVNAFNEYFDYKSGLDAHTSRTPFSGGSGTLQQKPELVNQVLGTAITAFIITGSIGIYFLFVRGFMLLPLGLLGLFLLIAYTPWFARSPLLCLIAPGLGFGPLMVMGTAFVLTGQYTRIALVASLIPFFLVSNLLLLNQFPDVEADRSIGRRHYPIVIGRRVSSLIYGAFLLLTFLAIILGVCLKYLPPLSLIGLMTLILAIPTFIGVYRHADDVKQLVPYMGRSVIVILLTPLLVSIGLLLG
jgi:1,4-dihydroxy-2-naphthoate octaprenyltransferase